MISIFLGDIEVVFFQSSLIHKLFVFFDKNYAILDIVKIICFKKIKISELEKMIVGFLRLYITFKNLKLKIGTISQRSFLNQNL